MFKGKKGQALAADIGKKSKTFVPGERLPEAKKGGPSKEDVAAIKVCYTFFEFMSNCKSFFRPYDWLKQKVTINLGPYSPTILKNILCLCLQDSQI